jgi:REP element-mobilizing transposase RayT
MPDHIHLFVAIDDQRLSLSDWMKSLKGTLSSALRAAGNSPPHWQKGFFGHVLRISDSYSQKWSICARESCSRWSSETLGRMAISW